MRILHVHKYYHDHDGAGRYLFDVMRLQEEAGHAVAIFAMHDARNSPSAWDKYFVSSLDTSRISYGLDMLRQPLRALWSIEARRKMNAILKAFRPDVVHLHNAYTHLSPSVLAACRAHGIPVVMTVHDYALVSANYGLWDGQKSLTPDKLDLMTVARSRYIKNSFLATWALEVIYRFHRALKLYDRVIAVYLSSSEFVKQTLVKTGYPANKIQVLSLFAGNFLGDATSPTSSTDRQGILFAGRLEDYKGIDLVLQAVEAFPKTKFFIAGTGPREADVREAQLKLDNLEYLGFLSSHELWAKMAKVELVIVPSRWAEPYGLVAIEAMACGTPVLVSDAGGLPEKVKDGVNGIIFKAGDIQDLNSKLKTILKHPKDLERMGQGAFRYAKANADPKKHIAKLFEVYEGVVIHK
jgi:glycosyltransferase involved in cell wall biosynthesis